MGWGHKLNKDVNTRLLFKKRELHLLLMKYNMSNDAILLKYKYFFFWLFLKRFKLVYSASRIVNRCVYTGRAYWVLRPFRLSRMTFKTFADYGKLNGIRRATW